MKLQELSKDNLPQSELFRDLVQKDLLYNVYSDGRWGSIRHLPMDAGKSPIVV